ncbi:chlorite dismutase family protein [Thermus caliditerrae]|uniref:chlorite dismutase family protein n=1 Tax=Thermus caliditerrae TaxID=1330700 RepID=UPI001F2889FF|nr:chlorite dismutase family protein [Thermus caliditerrae]
MRLWAFSLFRVSPEFRRLEAELQEHLKEEFAFLLERWQAREGFLAVYSLVGLSAEADLLLWQGAEEPKALQAFRRELHRTRLAGYLEPVALHLDRGEREPGEGVLALFPYGLEGLLPEGLRAFRGENLLALEGPWDVLFPLALREGGHLAVRRLPREALDEL